MKTTEDKVAAVSEYYVYTPSKIAEKMFFYPLQCGNFVYLPGYMLMRNAYDSFLLMFIRRGTLEIRFAGKTCEAKEGQFILMDCYEPHGYSTTVGYECLWMHFDGTMARQYYEQIVLHLGNIFTMENASHVLRLMNEIFQVFEENQPVREPLLSKIITDILTAFLLYVPDGERTGVTSAAEQSIAYINEHFSEDIPIELLAANAGISQSHFIRIFRQETGYTPHEYTVNRRMAEARYLLRFTAMTVKEICYSTGYGSESVFCNAFRKQHGMTPLEYRQDGTEPDRY